MTSSRRTETASRFVDVYQKRYRKYGDEYRALGWTDEDRVCVRHQVMADVIQWDKHDSVVELLDFGCGLAHFLDCVDNDRILYSGLDIVPEFVGACKAKHPNNNFYLVDVFDRRVANDLAYFDYVIANGVFTQKLETRFDDMVNYMMTIVEVMLAHARGGIAFNVMSSHVDWERDDLFHVPFDLMADLVSSLSPHYIMRNDYGLREYAVYVYH